MPNDSDSKILVGCLSAFIGLILYVPIVIYSTWAGAVTLSHLWEWFVIPLFDVPQLTLLQAAGLALVVGYLTKPQISTAKGEEDKTKLWTAITIALLSPWVTLLVGYVIHLMM